MDIREKLPASCKAYVYAPLLGLYHSFVGVARSSNLIVRSQPVRKAVSRVIGFNFVLLTSAYVAFEHCGPWLLGTLVAKLAAGYDHIFSLMGMNFGVLNRTMLWQDGAVALYGSVFCWLWAVPVQSLARVCSMFWYEKISEGANAFYNVSGQNRFARPASSVMSVADITYSVVVATFYYLMVVVLSYIPYVGDFVQLVLMALLYSYYIFEYTWFAQGIPLPQRVQLICTHWTYFAGFALPLSLVLTWFGSGVTAGVLPLYIIAAASNPMPTARDISTPVYLPAFTLPLRAANYGLGAVSFLQRAFLRRPRAN